MPWQLSLFCISEEKTADSWWGSLGAFVANESKLIESLALQINLRWADNNVTWRRDQCISKLWHNLDLAFSTEAYWCFWPFATKISFHSCEKNLSDHQCWWWVIWECKPVYIQGPHINFLSTILLKKRRRPKMKQRNDSRSSACSMSSPVDAVILLQWAG